MPEHHIDERIITMSELVRDRDAIRIANVSHPSSPEHDEGRSAELAIIYRKTFIEALASVAPDPCASLAEPIIANDASSLCGLMHLTWPEAMGRRIVISGEPGSAAFYEDAAIVLSHIINGRTGIG